MTWGEAFLWFTVGLATWLIIGPSVTEWLDEYQAVKYADGHVTRRARVARWLVVNVSVRGRRNRQSRTRHNAASERPADG